MPQLLNTLGSALKEVPNALGYMNQSLQEGMMQRQSPEAYVDLQKQRQTQASQKQYAQAARIILNGLTAYGDVQKAMQDPEFQQAMSLFVQNPQKMQALQAFLDTYKPKKNLRTTPEYGPGGQTRETTRPIEEGVYQPQGEGWGLTAPTLPQVEMQTLYGPGGQTKRTPITKGQEFVPSKDWSLKAPGEPTKPVKTTQQKIDEQIKIRTDLQKAKKYNSYGSLLKSWPEVSQLPPIDKKVIQNMLKQGASQDEIDDFIGKAIEKSGVSGDVL